MGLVGSWPPRFPRLMRTVVSRCSAAIRNATRWPPEQRHVFLTVWKLADQGQGDSTGSSGETLLPGLLTLPSCWSPKEEGFCLGKLTRTWMPSGPPSDLM